MPFDEPGKERQARAFGLMAIQGPYVWWPDPHHWTYQASIAHDVQALICLGLGRQIGYFEDRTSRYFGDLLLRRLANRIEGGFEAISGEQIERIQTAQRRLFGKPDIRHSEWRPELQLAFREMLVATMQLRRSAGTSRVVLDVAAFDAEDWVVAREVEGESGLLPFREGSVEEAIRRAFRHMDSLASFTAFAGDQSSLSDVDEDARRPFMTEDHFGEAILGALQYLRSTTNVVNDAYQWGEFTNSSFKSELSDILRAHVDTRVPRIKDHLSQIARLLARLTALSVYGERPRGGRSFAFAMRETLAMWEHDALRIVDEYDQALVGR